MDKPRKVLVTLEIETNWTLAVLRSRDDWQEMLVNGCKRVPFPALKVIQAQANVIRAPKAKGNAKPAKSKLTKAGKKPVKRANAKAPAKEGIMEALRAHHYKEAASEIMSEIREHSGMGEAQQGGHKRKARK